MLLFFASRRKPMAGDNSTGHVFDEDLVEMNNPLPRWWMVLFVLTVLFSFGYVYAFPGLGASPGTLGWTSRGELEADQAKVAASMAKVYAEYVPQPAEALSRDAQAMAIGERLFINNCAACHGSGRARQQGLPEPDRQRLAARRHAREDRGDDHPRPHRHDAADGRRGRQRRATCATSPTTC